MVLVKDVRCRVLGPGGRRSRSAYGAVGAGITLIGWSAGGRSSGWSRIRWGTHAHDGADDPHLLGVTGLSGFAETPMQLLVLRFIAAPASGVSGGRGASMIAEVFPKASRAVTAGVLQSASGTGFFAAILLEYLVGGNWRYAFFGGEIPAFIALICPAVAGGARGWVAAKKTTAGMLRSRRIRSRPCSASTSCASVCCWDRARGDQASSRTGARNLRVTRDSRSCYVDRAWSPRRLARACAGRSSC